MSTTPDQVDRAFTALTSELDNLSNQLENAHNALNGAEEAWERLYDDVAEELKQDALAEGKKADPAEHTILSVCRRQHRDEWMTYRRAKRAVDKLEKLSQNRRAELGGWQSAAGLLKAELSGPSARPPVDREQVLQSLRRRAS